MIESVEKFITFAISMFKPNKKTVNAVLYELARLALFFTNSEQLTSCGFHILNELMETQENTPNFKFASLNLLKNFENYSENALAMLSNHCKKIMLILKNEDEDDSLQKLALQVLPKITSADTLFQVLESLKSLLIKYKSRETNRKTNFEFQKIITTNIFMMLKHKANEFPLKRVQESIKLLLIVDEEVTDDDLSSLITLISTDEELQKEALKLIWTHFQGNWKQRGFTRLSMFVFGEFMELLDDNSILYTLEDVILCYEEIYNKLDDSKVQCYFLNNLAKIVAKLQNNSIPNGDLINRVMKMMKHFMNSRIIEVQNRSIEYHVILDSELSSDEKKEIFDSMPNFVEKEQKTTLRIKK